MPFCFSKPYCKRSTRRNCVDFTNNTVEPSSLRSAVHLIVRWPTLLAKTAEVPSEDHLFSFEESNMSSAVDFVIITPLEEERDALLHKLPEYQKNKPSKDDIWTYYSSDLEVTFPDGSQGVYEIVVMPLLGMGRVDATAATMDAIRRWNPRHVLLTGIAGGVAELGVKLGDILVSDQIVDYELQKVSNEGAQVRWEVYRADPRILGAIMNFTEDNWQQLISVPRPDIGFPKRHIGPIASGDKVIASTEVLLKYRDTWPKLVGVEMEGGGVALAAFQSPGSPGFVMIRAVSDFADEQKGSASTKAWRNYACDVAASYTIAFLKSGPIVSQIAEEIPLEIVIMSDSGIYRLPATLGRNLVWRGLFNLALYAFSNNPDPKAARQFSDDPSEYRILDLNSEEWISPPATVGKLRTDRVAFIHQSALARVPKLGDNVKVKWFARVIKQFAEMQKGT